jgi:hypothetical protein
MFSTNSNFVGCSIGRSPDALEDLVHLACGTPIEIVKACSIGHQTARVDHFPQSVNIGQPIPDRELGNLGSVGGKFGIISYNQRTRAPRLSE